MLQGEPFPRSTGVSTSEQTHSKTHGVTERLEKPGDKYRLVRKLEPRFLEGTCPGGPRAGVNQGGRSQRAALLSPFSLPLCSSLTQEDDSKVRISY